MIRDALRQAFLNVDREYFESIVGDITNAMVLRDGHEPESKVEIETTYVLMLHSLKLIVIHKQFFCLLEGQTKRTGEKVARRVCGDCGLDRQLEVVRR